MKKKWKLLLVLVVLALFPAAVFAQEIDPVGILLPETLDGYFGMALAVVVSWLVGEGFSWFQATLNNLVPGLDKRANIAISVGLVVVFGVMIMVLNTLATPEDVAPFEQAYALLRTVALAFIAYTGQQRAYVGQVRDVQQARKAE